MNVTLQYGPTTKLLNTLSAYLKKLLVTDMTRTEAKLDLDLHNTEDMVQYITIEVPLGNNNHTAEHPCR